MRRACSGTVQVLRLELWRVGASSIKEGGNAQMAQALFKIKEVWECVRQMGLQSDFRYFLDECADLVFEEVTHGISQSEWKLKEKYLNFSGHEAWLQPVTKSLIYAYEACLADKSRPLTYEMYAKFVSACVTWGTVVNNSELRYVKVEADEETYNKRRDRYIEAEAAKPAKPEDKYEKILRLLQELKGLVETTDTKVDVLYNDRQEQHKAAEEEAEAWKRQLAEHAETVKRRAEQEEMEKQIREEEAEKEKKRREEERARREAEAQGLFWE